MHFMWDVTFGQVIVGIPILWVVMILLRINRMMFNFRIEHETLMRDWARRQNPPTKLEDLPTRMSRWW